MRGLGKVGIAVAVVVWCVVAGDIARAADQEEPESLIQQAIELRRKGDNARAYGYLRRAYDIAHTPRSAAQLGLVEHALGRYADADFHLGEALATVDPWVQQNRERLEASRKFVRSKLARVEINGAPAGTTVGVGDSPPIDVPTDRIIYLAPGEHRLRIDIAGRSPLTQTVSIAAGETASVTVDLPPTPPVIIARDQRPAATAQAAAPTPSIAVTPGRDTGRALRITGIAFVAAGVAIGVAGFWARSIATSKLEAINRDADNGGFYDERNGNWKTFDRTSVAFLIGGPILTVAGVVLYAVNRAPAESKPSAGFIPTTGGGELSVAGRF